MSTEEERPKRSDQLPEDGPESVVPDDVPAEDPRSSEGELEEQDQGAGGPAATGNPAGG
jgi:hypothetical protein